MKPLYIKEFEKLGLGMFVHFGLYSMLGKGEWSYRIGQDIDQPLYFSDKFASSFAPKKDWAIKLVKSAKKMGAKYITLTTKHHEGYCLFDTKGLTTWDSLHHGEKRDFVREFVDACNNEGIKPFFYHALLDWHHPDYENNFASYIDYLIGCVKVLCSNYGKIGGLWFDGSWDKPNANWEFDRLYKTIRTLQPEAMIINNTGLSALGELTHPEIDSVTFERGTPCLPPANKETKEVAGEMCEVFGKHWGYTSQDIDYKPIPALISSLVSCRHCNCNLLLNVGPMGNGSLRPLDKAYMDAIGFWIKKNKRFIYDARRADIEAEGALVLQDEKYYYAFIENVEMSADPNVQLNGNLKTVKILGKKISSAIYLDNNEKVILEKDRCSFKVSPFSYGVALGCRVVRFKVR